MTPGAFNTYGITKSALSMLTQALASEVAVYKIRVNSIVPGTVEGPIMSRLVSFTLLYCNIMFYCDNFGFFEKNCLVF